MSRRTRIGGTPFQVEGGIVVKANPLNATEERYERDGLFIQYASVAVDAYGFSLDEDGRLAVAFTDALTSGAVLGLYWSESDGAYVLNLYNTIVAQFTATRILCEDIFAGSGDFDFVRINADSGPAAGIPGSGECVVYVQSSGGVDYLRVKFNSGAVREIANSSHNLAQFDGIGINGGIAAAGEIAFDNAGTIYSGGGLLAGDLTLACYGATGDIILSPAGQVTVNSNLQIAGDSLKLLLGAGDDVDFYYDGTAAYIHTDLVTASDLHLDCGTDKTLVLDESVWDDIQFSVSSGRVGMANYPDWDTFTANTSEYKFDVNDWIDLGANEMAHWWKEGTTVYPHVHVALDGGNSAGYPVYVKFVVVFAYADEDEVWTETTDTIEIEIPDGTADMTHLFGQGSGVSLSGKTIGTQVKVRLKRVAATSDEYPNHIFVTQCGLHAEKDTMGSRQVGTK